MIARIIRSRALWVAVAGFASIGRVDAINSPASPAPPTPEEGTTFHLFVGDQYNYDSNLYRIPANFGPVATLISPNASRADRYNVVSAGGIGQFLIGRQDIDLSVRVDNTRFAHNTELDNTGGDGLMRWYWRVGPYFSGDVGGEFNRTLAGFAETRYLGRDMVDNTDYFGTARYQAGPRWAVFGGIRDLDIRHGAGVAAYNNFQTESGNAGVEFATGVADSFALEYRYTKGFYPQNYTFDNVQFNRDFVEEVYRGKINYALSEKLGMDGYAGYMTHTLPVNNNLPSSVFGNFSGAVWRVSFNWAPTEKTQLAFAGWRELHAYLVEASNYFISKGGSVSPQWHPTDKITLAVVGSVEYQNFVAIQTAAGLAAAPRNDRVTAAQINLNYVPRDRWSVNVFFRDERRGSSQPAIPYTDRLGNIDVTYKFW
ncbi:MAG: hypothetical protein M3N97_07575 [Pseudomonadota bacterium]|nr:hypothetical protein [Pseudomonadota bacterium]